MPIKKMMLPVFFIMCLPFVLTACSTTTYAPMKTFNPNNNQNSTGTDNANNDQSSTYNVQLGMGYFQEGDMQRAKRKLLQALQQEPNSAQALDAMAYYLENTGDSQSANQYYQQAVTVAPKDGKAHNNYGTFLCRSKRYLDADKEFMLAVQDPAYLNNAEAYENAGLCAQQIPDANKAMGYFQKAVQNDPSRSISYLELSQLTYNQGNFPLAQQYFDKYAALNKNMGPEGLWLGIRLARKLGDPNTAGNYSLQLQSKYPHSTEYQQLYASQINKSQNNDAGLLPLSKIGK